MRKLTPAWIAAAGATAAAVSFSLLGTAQTPVKIAFDVASIRPAPDIATVVASHQIPHIGTHIDGARVDIGFASLKDLICTAYDVKPYQVSAPDAVESWINAVRFDIAATLPAGATQDQVPQMLQSLLADRFHLVLHRDRHSESVYALEVDEGGPKISPAAPEPPAPAPAPGAKAAATFNTADGGTATVAKPSANGSTTVTVNGGKNGPMQIAMGPDGLELQAERMTLAQFADTLSGLVGKPVLDMTGLAGPYQIHLAVSRDDLQALAIAALRKNGMPVPPQMQPQPGEATAPSGSSIFASVQKLGLKLDARNAPVGRVVIDSVDKTPTAN